MKVEKIFFAKSQWIGFLGYHENEKDSGHYSESQYFEIYSPNNLAKGIHTIKAKEG